MKILAIALVVLYCVVQAWRTSRAMYNKIVMRGPK